MNMDPAIAAAVIGGAGAIAAAVIAGLLKRRKREQATQSAQAGGHAIVAGGQAVQTVHIGPQTPPTPNTLLTVAVQILNRTNESLVENERLLSPVIHDPAIRYSVGQKLATLFEEQRDRGAFGEWQAFLSASLAKETEPRVKTAIEELLAVVRGLHRAFYSYHEAVEDKGEPETKKHFVELVLGNHRSDPGWYQVPDEEIVRIVRRYLDFLRTSVEKIGRATGKLKALVE